jgi:ABC-type glycerol-3-phosphate transport system substrate-binding protein
MHINRLTSAYAIVMSVGALLAAGCASAETKTPAAGGTSEARTTAADGTVHLIGYSLDSDGPDFTVILTGAVGDYGPAVTVHPNGTVDPEHTSELRLGLKKGSFRLNIANLDKKVVSATSHWASTATCSFHLRVTAATRSWQDRAPVSTGGSAGASA